MTDDVKTSTSIQPAPASAPILASSPAPAPEEMEEGSMSIWDHLNELRKRLFIGVIAMVVTSGLSFVFALQIIDVLAIPVGGIGKFQSIEVTENLGVFMRVSLLTGFIFSLPILLYEILAFIMPGLTDKEQRWVYLSIPVATVLFLAGVAFAYFILLPISLPFLTGEILPIPTLLRPAPYIEFVTSLMFWIGVVFEMPLIMFILAKLGLVTSSFLLKGWRYAVIIIAVVAAVITPTSDPITMGIMMAPLIALYGLSVFLAAVAGRNPTRTPKEH